MKMTLIGGGGVRAPEFVRGALAFADEMGLQELWLMDTDGARLQVMGPLCQEVVRRARSDLRLHFTQDLSEALREASAIVTTMRVGQERARVLDERIALKHGVLGQETTGPGGFSMAMRSVPAIIEVAALAEALAPRAWIFNFTNPAGLVVQALHEAGFRRIVGICDSANSAQRDIADYLGVPLDDVKTEVFGLNHLSWTRSARVRGCDRLPGLLADAQFIEATHQRFFGAEVVQRIGMYLNEYLYYYYCRDIALARIQAEELTRGEEIEQLNEALFRELRALPPAEGLAIHERYHARRNASYMAYAEPDMAQRERRAHPADDDLVLAQAEVGGYAGVALRVALALSQDRPLRIGLNVPNAGAIDGLRADDIVEVTCDVDGGGIRPIAIGAVPEDAYLLMRSVKRYERLAARAILERDRALAVDSLAAHPLVGSYSLARTLVEEYLEAHAAYVGEWR
ncbi:MAG: 6-phospho-beta-glucosidase [Aggregatilineales bacterium]